MKKIKLFCPSEWNFEIYHEKQIEFYVDIIPQNNIPENTIRIVMLLEPIEILNLNNDALFAYEKKYFNFLLTHNEELLKQNNNFCLFEYGSTWINNYIFPEKKFGVSALVGNKNITQGHYLRKNIWLNEGKIKKIPTKFFNSGNCPTLDNGNKNPLLGIDKSPLFDTQFHICIENTRRNNWFTEKLIDCLQTKTIPIYWGCPNISKWFNTDGFIIANDMEDIIHKCNLLTDKTYNNKIKAIEENFEKSKLYSNIFDRIEQQINFLIEKHETESSQ